MKTIFKCWKYSKNKELNQELVDYCGSSVVAQLLANREITGVEQAKEFLEISRDQFSSPDEFEDMEKVVNRISEAIDKNEHILIWGDYDADGITGTSILLKTLRFLGANVSFYIPDRITEGYGINSASLLKNISTRKARLILTTDCGISNLQEISLAKNFKVDVIVTDHHELPAVLPSAYAIINPKLLDSGSKMSDLCGAGVAYKTAQALLDHFGKAEYLDGLLYLAAIGTIADLVPLKKENRVIAHFGMLDIQEKQPLALSEIAKNAGISITGNFNSYTIAFTIAPRLNALGRLQSASIAVELLTSEDIDIVINLAKRIEQVNRERKDIVDQTYEEAVQMLRGKDFNKDKAIVLASKTWHPGVIGIVASRLVDTFYRPTFLMAIDGEEVKGSARGVEGIHLFDLLTEMKHIFNKYGGHEAAAGFSLSVNRLNEFISTVSSGVNSCLSGVQLEPCINIELKVEPEDLDIELIETINRLAPFGMANPEPLLCCNNLQISHLKLIGSNNDHMKLQLKSETNKTLDALFWKKNSIDFDQKIPVDVAFTPELNTFNSETKIQLIVKDLKPLSDQVIEKTVNEVKWVDHRKKSNINSLFKNYIKTKNANIAVFAESQHFLNHLKLDCPVVNRLTDDKYKELIVFEYPPEPSVIKDIIDNVSPEVIHLAPLLNYIPLNETDTVKTIIKMLKYAESKMNGEADIHKMAIKLGVSLKVISSAIDVLIASRLIDVTSLRNNVIKFRFLDKNGTNMTDIKEMEVLKNSILEVYSFRKSLIKKPVTEYSKH